MLRVLDRQPPHRPTAGNACKRPLLTRPPSVAAAGYYRKRDELAVVVRELNRPRSREYSQAGSCSDQSPPHRIYFSSWSTHYYYCGRHHQQQQQQQHQAQQLRHATTRGCELFAVCVAVAVAVTVVLPQGTQRAPVPTRVRASGSTVEAISLRGGVGGPSTAVSAVPRRTSPPFVDLVSNE
jgi:hypothetical protein